MERWMIVYLLPLEIWMDIFCYPWIKRGKFGQLIDKIGNFKFAEHAQFYLHEWGKHGLGYLEIKKNGLHKLSWDEQTERYCSIPVGFPQTQMPEKITSFERIEIWHFDANTVDFLDKIRPLLLNPVCIECSYVTPEHLENTRTALTRLVPLVDGIHLVDCSELTLPLLWQCFPREQLAKSKRMDYFCYEEADQSLQEANANTIMDWLTAAPTADGPKMCKVIAEMHYNFSEPIITTIRQQFLHAKTPHTFAVNFHYDLILVGPENESNEHATNGIGEELHSHLSEWELEGLSNHTTSGRWKHNKRMAAVDQADDQWSGPRLHLHLVPNIWFAQCCSRRQGGNGANRRKFGSCAATVFIRRHLRDTPMFSRSLTSQSNPYLTQDHQLLTSLSGMRQIIWIL